MRERLSAEVRRQGSSSGRVVAWVVGIAVVLLAIALAIGLHRGIGVSGVLRDPYSLTHERWTSVVSNAGLMLWVTVIAVCGFAALVIDRTRPPGDRWRAFLLGALMVTAILLLDDALSFHESGDDLWTSLTGEEAPSWVVITEVLFWGAVGLAFAIYLWRARDVVVRTEYLLLVLSAGLLVASVGVDVLGGVVISAVGRGSAASEVLEEGLKVLGIVVYATYFFRSAAQAVRESSIRGTTGA